MAGADVEFLRVGPDHRSTGQHELVLIDISERRDARQQLRAAARGFQKDIDQGAGGPPGRHHDAVVDKHHRIGRAGSGARQAAVQNRAGERTQKRLTRGNGVDGRFGATPGHDQDRSALSSASRCSASTSASGVPTCIHRPSNSRP